MDPDATLNEVITLIESGDKEGAADAADNLVEWMRKKGFAPKVDYPTLDFLLTTIADHLRK